MVAMLFSIAIFGIEEVYEAGKIKFISYRYEIKEVSKVREDKAR